MTAWKRGAVVCGALAATVLVGRAQAQTAVPNQAQVVGILQVVNEGDMHEASLALARSSNAGVRAYANMIIAVRGFVSLRATQHGLEADRSSPLATQFQNETAQHLQTLEPLSGAAFDKAYLEGQVSHLQAVLQLIDQLIAAQGGGTGTNTCPPIDTTAGQPSARLAAFRSNVQVHLFAAQNLLAELGT